MLPPWGENPIQRTVFAHIFDVVWAGGPGWQEDERHGTAGHAPDEQERSAYDEAEQDPHHTEVGIAEGGVGKAQISQYRQQEHRQEGDQQAVGEGT